MPRHIFKKIKQKLWMLRSLPWSIYINFHYLPIRQAWHLPIMVYKARFLKLGGSIEILGGGRTWYDTVGPFPSQPLSKQWNYAGVAREDHLSWQLQYR